MWKNLKHIVDVVEKDCVATKAAEAEAAGGEKKADGDAEEDDQSNSEYILLKDLNKLVLRLFKKDLQEEEEDEEEAEEEKNWVYIIKEWINYTQLTKINF